MSSVHDLARLAVPALVVMLSIAGCGPATPNYESIYSTSSTTTTTSAGEAPPVSFSDYLENLGVTGAPVAPDKLTDLTVDVPTPAGWQPYVNANLSPGTRTIAKGDTYPTAMVLVFQLTGNFDAVEAVKHADGDAEMSENFKKLNGSQANYRRLPVLDDRGQLRPQRSAHAELQPHRHRDRHTSEPGAPGQRYLVQLTVTSFADQAQANAPDIEKIIKGFSVKAK